MTKETIFMKKVNVHSWDSKDINYMGKIMVSSTILGKYVGKKVQIIVKEI